ncbi:MAG: leucyl/phenylalanyl-tRNA--protein transferase [Actinomycetota bacterium]
MTDPAPGGPSHGPPGGRAGAHRAPPPTPVGPSRWALPSPDQASEDGVVGVGGDLAPETLVDAYRRGMFPWPHPGMPLPWFSPDPRAVVRPHRVTVAKSLRQRLRRCGWTTTVDADFDEVVAACALRPGEGTWVNRPMRQAYGRLHRLGWAHSLEVWDGERLVGGLYGVRVGACFTGESMFHRATDASKAALVDLCARWAEAGGELVDVQLPTAHLESMGAVAVDRADFLAELAEARLRTVCMVVDRLAVGRLVPPRPAG